MTNFAVVLTKYVVVVMFTKCVYAWSENALFGVSFKKIAKICCYIKYYLIRLCM